MGEKTYANADESAPTTAIGKGVGPLEKFDFKEGTSGVWKLAEASAIQFMMEIGLDADVDPLLPHRLVIHRQLS